MTAITVAPTDALSAALLLEIAAKPETPETRNRRVSTRRGFHAVAVWSIRAAPHRKPPSPLAKLQPAEQAHSHDNPPHHRQ